MEITGYTNKIEVKNQQEAIALGARRAEAVKDYIASRGVRPDIMATRSGGWRDLGYGSAMNRVAGTRLR